jgi:hypothetical protein
MNTMKVFFQVTKLEVRRILRSYRFIVILMACILPMFLYLDLFARQQSVSIALQGETWFKIRSLQVFVFFAPFLSELVAILLVADLVGGEKRSSLMVLFSSISPRLVTLFGKFTAAVLLTGIGIIASLGAFDLLLILWGAPMPALSSQIVAFILVLFASLLAASITLFTTSFLISQEKGSAIGSLVPIFLFFVLSFLIETSIRFQFIDNTILNYTFLQQLINIQRYFFFLDAEKTSLSAFYTAIGVCSLTIILTIAFTAFIVKRVEF